MAAHSQVRIRSLLTNALSLLLTLSTTYMGWKSLCALTLSPSPITCVTSESMAPAFHRGDILFLSNRQQDIQVGDIPVVWFPGYYLPMVHRAIKVWDTVEGRQFLTKGDNNNENDLSLYPKGRAGVKRDEVRGLVRAYIPLLGQVVIGFQESLFGRVSTFSLP